MVVPNYNGADTIALCLEALLASDYGDFEVVVVDDGSSDASVQLIESFVGRHSDRLQSSPFRLLRMPGRCGAAAARNAGAAEAGGKFLFFIDADCVVTPRTLALAAETALNSPQGVVVGGTYTPHPFDSGFYSLFQSVFIHHFEVKRVDNPDYVASHALLISAAAFRSSGGFPQNFMPIIEDVEFSHRLRRQGHLLRMEPKITVRHIFNYDLKRSLANARRKAHYWTIYSLGNHDLLSDSGTASRELKFNVLAFVLGVVMPLVLLFPAALAAPGSPSLFSRPLAGTPALWLLPGFSLAVQVLNLLVQRGLLSAFARTGGSVFALKATLYYLYLYPLPVGWGGVEGLAAHLLRRIRHGFR
mgnify:CR=1 FL=1